MKSLRVLKMAMVVNLLLAGLIFAHGGGHKKPGYIPAVGPNGGKYAKIGNFYSEVVVRNNQVKVYVLERDLKNIAESVKNVKLKARLPRSRKNISFNLKFNKKDSSFYSAIKIPRRERVVFFYVNIKVNKKWRKARLAYEPRR